METKRPGQILLYSAQAKRLPPMFSPIVGWLCLHVALPAAIFAAVWYVLVTTRGDFRWAHVLLDAQGGSWVLKQHLVTEGVVHSGGRLVSALAWIGVLAFSLLPARFGTPARWRSSLRYLAICVVCSVALVSGIKRLSAVDCPWNVEGFGGDRPALGSMDARPAALPPGHCFPAGHSSLGYAWLALYFAAFGARRWRLLGLASGLALGLVFGISQQLRGAHFASHDLVTAMLCWCVAVAWLPLLHREPTGSTVP